MIASIVMWNCCSPENIATLKFQKWEKTGNNSFTTKKISITHFYEITNIHIPSIFAVYDNTLAKTGYTKNGYFNYYLTYTRRKDGFILQAVVAKNNRKVVNIKTTPTMWDFLGMFQK